MQNHDKAKIKTKNKGSGQECPLHILSNIS